MKLKNLVLTLTVLSGVAVASEPEVVAFYESVDLTEKYPDYTGMYIGDFEYYYKSRGVGSSVVTLFGAEGVNDAIYMAIIDYEDGKRRITFGERGVETEICSGEGERINKGMLEVEGRKVYSYIICGEGDYPNIYAPISSDDREFVVGQFLTGPVTVNFSGVEVEFESNGFAYAWDGMKPVTRPIR